MVGRLLLGVGSIRALWALRISRFSRSAFVSGSVVAGQVMKGGVY